MIPTRVLQSIPQPELYHRASFTLTGQFPSPEEYQELIDNDVFDETDYLDKLSTDQNDTANILTANTNADRDLSTGNTTDSDTDTTNSILYQDAFYERLGEALEDLLLIREGGAGDVDALFALDNLAYQRRMTFEQKYDADLSSAPSFACLPEQDFEYDSTCNPNQPGLPSFYDGEGLSDELHDQAGLLRGNR